MRLITSLIIIILMGCMTPRWQKISEDKQTGIITMGYMNQPPTKTLDIQKAKEMVKQKCQDWGYSDTRVHNIVRHEILDELGISSLLLQDPEALDQLWFAPYILQDFQCID